MKDIYSGFHPSATPKPVINGAALGFFCTSALLAVWLFPLLMSSPAFLAGLDPYLPPTEDQVLDIARTTGLILGWTLLPFLIAVFLWRKRKLGVYAGGLLVLGSIWFFRSMPFTTAGNVLLILLWTAMTGWALFGWEELA